MRWRPVKVRAATRAKPALVNAVHAFYHGEDVGMDQDLVSVASSVSGAAEFQEDMAEDPVPPTGG